MRSLSCVVSRMSPHPKLRDMTHVALAALIAATLHLLLVTTDHALLTLLAASIATVALVVFGIPFLPAPPPPGSSRITAALLSRESLLPLGMALGAVTSGQVAPETAAGSESASAPRWPHGSRSSRT